MLNESLKRLVEAAQSPRSELDRCLAEGKAVAGCIPEYTPEPLLHAAGLIPFGLWGGQTAIARADAYIPTFACSLVRSCAELGLSGAYRGLRVVVAPILCDALKGCVQTFRVAVKEIPTLPFSVPQNRTLPTAAAFLEGEYAALQKKLEALTGRGIPEEALWNSIRIYNEHSAAMNEFDRVAANHTDVITPQVRQQVYQSAWYMEKSAHTALVRDVTAWLVDMPAHTGENVRVILTGVTAGSPELMEVFAQEGFDVVGDWVYQNSWTYQRLIPEDAATPLAALAGHWMRMGGGCVTHEPRRTRGDTVLHLAEERRAKGIILSLMKFCDPEEYEAPLLLEQWKPHYPVLVLDINQNSDDLEQLRTRLQSFREVLQG